VLINLGDDSRRLRALPLVIEIVGRSDPERQAARGRYRAYKGRAAPCAPTTSPNGAANDRSPESRTRNPPRRRRRRPLFEKADALIQRHASFAIESELDDLPVLTDVDERSSPHRRRRPHPRTRRRSPPSPSCRRPVAAEARRLAERLVTLDTAISRHIEEWVATELPSSSPASSTTSPSASAKAAAHLRATLLPLISAEIADTLDNGPEA
jgi:hypothetical protein